MFLTYKLWGTAGGPGRECTSPNRSQASQKLCQKSYFCSGFTVFRGCHRLGFLPFGSGKQGKTEHPEVTGLTVALQNPHFRPGKRGEAGDSDIIGIVSRACATKRRPSEIPFSFEKTPEKWKPRGRENRSCASEFATCAKSTSQRTGCMENLKTV